MTDKTTHQHGKELQALLKRAFPPFETAELQRDLWPRMLRRLDAQPFRVPWLGSRRSRRRYALAFA